MKILVISQTYYPEGDHGLNVAKGLRDQGHLVEVLTGFPNYPEGRLYPGFQMRLRQKDVVDGIPIYRVPLYPSHDQSGLRRILTYLSFGISAAAIGPWLVSSPDVVCCYNLLTLCWAADLFRFFRRAKIIFNVQDIWPESVLVSGMMRNRLLLNILEWWCRRKYRRPDRLMVLSPGFKEKLMAKGVPGNRIDVVYNSAPQGELPLVERNENISRQLGFRGRFNVVFAGTMGKAQALHTVVEAARLLIAEAPDVLFTLIGNGVSADSLKQQAQGLENIHFLPRRPAKEIGEILGQADALLIHLKDDPLFRITIPSKTQGALREGKPILMGVAGDASVLVEEARAGVCFDPENPQALVKAVLQLYRLSPEDRDRMGKRGQEFYQRHLSLQREVCQWIACFERALGSRN